MPLFDSLEREVSSFFVAQGSIFDTILKTVVERLAVVETRVDASVLTINKLAQNVGHANNAGLVVGGGSNEELEYFIMTLARQLNTILALLFQPCAKDAVAKTHERQQQLPTISHVLADNESILTDLAFPKAAAESLEDDTKPQSANASTIARQTSGDDDHANAQEPSRNRSDDQSSNEMTNPADIGSLVTASGKEEGGTGRDKSEAALKQTTQTRALVKSAFTMIQHLHSVEEKRRRHEQELAQRMQRLVNESQMACQAHCKGLHDQNNAILRELQHQNDKLSSEWAYHQQKLASVELLHAQLQDQQQKELDKQLLELSNAFLASQTAQEQQIARILDNLREFGDRFLSKTDLDQLATNWLQTARDDCIYGANVETLTKLQHDLVELQLMLRSEMPSPAQDQLTEEMTSVLEVLDPLLKMLEDDSNALHGPNGSQLMQKLRHMVGRLDDLAHNAMPDAQPFLTNLTRQMELGTASLLEALERQQEGYQQALSQQQADLELLKLEIQAQKLADEELRKQLMDCPNQEDTMRLVNALKEQIQALTSDSASRMLDTVDDLRSKMAGLPTHDFLEELLHSKADRSEIDRLRLLLASQAQNGTNGPSLSKSPTRCLSCDQSLPFTHSRPSSAAPHANDNDRPSSAGAHSPSRPSSRGSSANHKTHHQSMVALPAHTHTVDDEHHDHGPNRFVSPFTRAMFLVSEHGIPSTQDILRDLAATIESTKRRRQRMQDQQDQLTPLAEERTLLSFAAGPLTSGQRKSIVPLGTPEDRKNKIPLRRTTLSDQVVYGPSITSGFIKPRKSTASVGPAGGKIGALGSARRENEEVRISRPKTAVTNERRPPSGDVIMRTPSTTAVIRPFSEISRREEPSGRRNTRGV